MIDHISEYGVPILKVEGPPHPDIGGYIHYEHGPQWTCRYCGLAQSTEDDLRAHLRSVHPNVYPANTTDEDD